MPGPAEAGIRVPVWARYSSIRERVGEERNGGGDSGDMGENLDRSSTDRDHFLPAVARKSSERVDPGEEGGIDTASWEVDRFIDRLSTDLT